jgi:sulfur carrier protein
MTLFVNGHLINDFKSMSLKRFLDQKGLAEKRIAVELNGQVVPRSTYESTVLECGDKIEIIGVIGGG